MLTYYYFGSQTKFSSTMSLKKKCILNILKSVNILLQNSKIYDIICAYLLAGVAIGGGWQALVAYINLGCYYVFGLPLGFTLGYVAKLGAKVN